MTSRRAVAGLWLCAASFAFAQEPPERERARAARGVAEAQATVLRGDEGAARRGLDQALEHAPADVRAKSYLELADTSARVEGRAAARGDAEALYRQALTEAALVGGGVSLHARNNYAAFLLSAERPSEALALLEADRVEMQRAEFAAARPRFLYNYGQALERTDQHQAALASYREALRLDPAFDAPAQAAVRLALASPSETVGIPATLELVHELVSQGRHADAAEHLRRAFQVPRWRGHPLFPRLAGSLAEYLAAARVTREAFEKEWWPALSPAASSAAPRLADIATAYRGELPLVLDPDEARARYATAWFPDEDLQRFARLLGWTGELLRSLERPQDALGSLALAWALLAAQSPDGSPDSIAAAVQLTDLLLAQRERLDPQGRLLDGLVERLYSGKLRAYARADDANVLRFHLLLGSVFERVGRLGPEDDPRTALFQYRHALRSHEQLRQSDPATDLAQVPGLYERLARVYETLGDSALAAQAASSAAWGYVALGRPQDAQRLGQRALDLGLVAAERPRLEELLRQLESQV